MAEKLKTIDKISLGAERFWKPLQWFLAFSAAMGGLVIVGKDYLDRRKLKVSEPVTFSDQALEVAIPGLSDALFCALTRVETRPNIPAPGWCRVAKTSKGWVIQTGPPGYQICEVTCLK
jgi:hypothetical protein